RDARRSRRRHRGAGVHPLLEPLHQVVVCVVCVVCHRLRRAHQKSSPPSRAPSAIAATRPWYRLPPRSNTTAPTPAALAPSATRTPTARALAGLPPPTPRP